MARLLVASTFGVALAALAACGLDVIGTDPIAPDTSASDGGSSGRPNNPSGDDASSEAGTIAPTCDWPSLEQGAVWPMIGGCVRHPGRTVYRGPKTQPKIVWKVSVTTRESQPVIGADDTIYLPADTDGIIAFDPDGGRRPIPDAGTGSDDNVTNAPSIGKDGTLYFGSGEAIMALHKDGTSWRFETNGEVDTSTLLDEQGNVYSGSFSNDMSSVSPDGTKRWTKDLGDDVWSAAALGQSGNLYVGASNHLSAFSLGGDRQWVFDTHGDIQSSPVVADDGTIYIGTTDARLHAIEPDGGAKWTFVAKGNFGWQQLPALAKDGKVYAPSSGFLAAVDPADGGVVWERAMNVNLRTSVIVDPDGTIYVGGDSMLFAIDPMGNEVWHLQIDGNPSGFAIGRDGTMYVACNNDTFFALHD